MSTPRNLPPEELKELRDAAYDARERVSNYSPEKRAELEEKARSHAPATPALSQIREEIQRLDKAATRGPWHWVRRDTDEACDYTKPEEGVVKGAEFEVFFNVSLRTQWEQPASIGGTLPEFIIDDEEEILRADAELIAYLRNNIASLLSIADILERRDMAVKAALDECHHAFRDRKHGGVAEGTLRTRLEEIFIQPYQQST